MSVQQLYQHRAKPVTPNQADLGGGLKVGVGTPAAILTYKVPLDSMGHIYFTIANLSSETIGVTYSVDGVNYKAIGLVRVISTGLTNAGTALGNGEYYISMYEAGSPAYIKFTKSATTETGVVAVACPGAVSAFEGNQLN